MEHDRWSWFAGGVVLGLLIGAGVVGGYSVSKLAEETARHATELENQKAEYESLRWAYGSLQLWKDTGHSRAEKAEQALLKAEKEVEELKSAKKDR